MKKYKLARLSDLPKESLDKTRPEFKTSLSIRAKTFKTTHMRRKSILVAANYAGAGETIGAGLGQEFRVEEAGSLAACLEAVRVHRFEFIFLALDFLGDRRSGEVAGENETVLDKIVKAGPSAHIIVLTPGNRVKEALEVVNAGAADYLVWPCTAEEAVHVVQMLLESRLRLSELDYLRDRFWLKDYQEVVRTSNPLMRKVFESVRTVAPTKSTVLLTGETGTGKTLIAKLLHRHSRRSNQQFIAVHCGAIPDTLLESELFGHEKGAFTGAIRKKLGKFEIADGGTIFLDEIGTLTPAAQIKLLQVLQERSFERVGGEVVIKTDVRIIAASNSDLWQMAAEGQFRKDLLYRLIVFPIHIPSLAERIEDVPVLAELFVRRLNNEYLKDIKGIHPEVLTALSKYEWPGNVRELENIMERAVIIEESPYLTRDSFPAELFEAASWASPLPMDTELTLAETKHRALELVEVRYLRDVLTKNRGSINKTAANAGISTRQLHKLMSRYGLHKEDFK